MPSVGDQHQSATDAWRREVIRHRPDRDLLLHHTRDRIQAVQDAIAADRPDQAGGDNRRSTPHRGNPLAAQCRR